MPSYDYQCSACNYEFEEFQSISSDALQVCPSCGESALKRLVGGGIGVIFKGSGFYVTDSKGAKAGANGNGGKAGSSKNGADGGGESKPAGDDNGSKGGSGSAESAGGEGSGSAGSERVSNSSAGKDA